ncbi:MAG: hypothetical protein CMB80_31140 [Flammeovirgaceae bacterium]|nr:hypothetical protein [Flammeovirgaceae bacterium]|tara:strand:- start:261 stop:473 length:213 start_codon:yes stop_codon:yes gene_type:complete
MTVIHIDSRSVKKWGVVDKDNVIVTTADGQLAVFSSRKNAQIVSVAQNSNVANFKNKRRVRKVELAVLRS